MSKTTAEVLTVEVGQIWQRKRHKKHGDVLYEVVFDWGDGTYNLKCISNHVAYKWNHSGYRRGDSVTVRDTNMARIGWKLVENSRKD